MPTSSPGADFGHASEPVDNCFSMAALRSDDGAFLLGEMAHHTYNAGQIYFPAGTPDPDDVFDDRVDLEASARRELFEETGLIAAEANIAPGWTLAITPQRIACMKLMTLPLPAVRLKARIEAYLARDPLAEFSRMHIVRAPEDIDEARVPVFVADYLRHEFASEIGRIAMPPVVRRQLAPKATARRMIAASSNLEREQCVAPDKDAIA